MRSLGAECEVNFTEKKYVFPFCEALCGEALCKAQYFLERKLANSGCGQISTDNQSKTCTLHNTLAKWKQY